MTEFLKNNLSIRDFIYLLVLMIPGLMAWNNMNNMQEVQQNQIIEVKKQLEKMDSKVDQIGNQVIQLRIDNNLYQNMNNPVKK